MTEIERKTGMTDAECEYWDRHIIENTVEPGPNLLKLGIKLGFANKALKMIQTFSFARIYAFFKQTVSQYLLWIIWVFYSLFIGI